MTRRQLALALVAAALCCAGACAGDAASPPAEAAAAAPVAAIATAPAEPRKPTQVRPWILSVTPDSVNVMRGRILKRQFEVEYAIDNPDAVDKAELQVYAKQIGVLHRTQVPVREKGTIAFELDAMNVDAGRRIEFRAVCPEHSTEWYALGEEPLPPGPERDARLMIGPDSVPFSRENQPGEAVPVSISGKQLTKDCSIETRVAGSPVELMNTHWWNGRFNGLLPRRIIGFGAIPPRYLELKLSVRGPKVGLVAITRLKFTE